MKILNTLLTLGCLGGLVSCYPVAAQNTTGAKPTIKKTVSVNTPSTVTAKKKINTAKRTTKKRVTKKRTPKTSYKKTVSNTPKTVEKKVVTAPKPAAPTVIKKASKVPGKEGFVFNPYTYNQVDVRGVPSGSKVRDPNDANPAHVFRVP